MSVPYTLKGDKSFWKKAVGETGTGKALFNDIQMLPFISKETRFASAGSCFAQHVGKWLLGHDYHFNRSELVSDEVSSFSFGNIYTPRQLLQWLQYSDNQELLNHPHSIYRDQGKFFDLLMPNRTPSGFVDEEALITERENSVAEMVAVLRRTDVFIFTLGLTEAWRDEAGFFYPACPGVVAGQFDENIHHFHNFNYDEIVTDLKEISRRLTQINPDIKVVLTVSPVPLTATATDEHVLVATVYSKAVLRAAAGGICQSETMFSYFPSYEIITVQDEGDFRFEKNKRTVTPEGVDYVMQHFSASFKNSQPTQQSTAQRPNDSKDDFEVICDDELLEAYARQQGEAVDVDVDLTPITLVGDSHIGKIAKEMLASGKKFSGGMIMPGSSFTSHLYELDAEKYFIPQEEKAQKLWEAAYKNIAGHERSGDPSQSYIVTNIGVQSHKAVPDALSFSGLSYEKTIGKEVKIYSEYFKSDRKDEFDILCRLQEKGHKVLVVLDPIFARYSKQFKETQHYGFHEKYQDLYLEAITAHLTSLGLPFLNAINLFKREFKKHKKYYAFTDQGVFDPFHGNDLYYKWLVKKIVQRLK